MAVTLVAFEALAVATVLPVVARQLGDLRLYGWVFSAFLLSSLIGIVTAGTWADRRGLVGPMLAGLVLFAAGLLIGGTAPAMPVLVAGRAVQGLGAGVVPATAYVAISRGYPGPWRPRMFAVLSTAWVVPGLSGPAIAAAVAAAVGWRWVFLGLLPLVAVAAAVVTRGLRSLPSSATEPSVAGPSVAEAAKAGKGEDPSVAETPIGAGPEPEPAMRRMLPVLGVVVGAGLALGGLSSGRAALAGMGVVVGGALLLVMFCRLTPPGTLRARPGLPATILSRGLLTFGFYVADAYVPYTLTTVRHAPTFIAGLALTAGTMTWTGGAWVQARQVQRSGPRWLVRSGRALVIGGIALMGAVLSQGVPPELGILAWAVAGAGMGLAYAPLSVATLDRAVKGQEGKATSSLQLADVLGQAVGTGVGGAAVAFGVSSIGRAWGVALAFSLGVAVGVLALVVDARLPDRLLSREPGPGDVASVPDQLLG